MLGPRNTCKGKCHMQFAIWYPWQCYIEVSFLQAIKEALKDDGFTKELEQGQFQIGEAIEMEIESAQSDRFWTVCSKDFVDDPDVPPLI